MIKNLATIDISRNFPGQKICLKKLEKCKENTDMKERNKTTAILVWLNKFNKKQEDLNCVHKKKSERNFTHFQKIISCGDDIAAKW